MKYLISAILSFSLVSSLISAQRRPVLENFTNHTCGFCVTYEPNMTQFIEDYHESLTVLRYHVSWPSSNDPFYMDNRDDNNGRTSYYGVSGVPDNYMDGQIHVSYPPTLGALENAYIAAISEPCYVDIILSGVFDPITKQGNINAVIIAEEEPGPGRYYLHIAAVSEKVNYASGYFSSFSQPMRKMFPYYGGTLADFSDTFPDTLTLNVNFQLNQNWWHYEEEQIYFAVWLQSGVLPYKHIYQSSVIDISELAAVGIDENSEDQLNSMISLGVYPNIIRNSARIYFGFSSEKPIFINVLDVSGRTVKSFDINSLTEGKTFFEADFSDLSTGVYMIKIKSGSSIYTSALRILR